MSINTSFIEITSAIGTKISVDIKSTAITIIIVASSIVSFIIAIAITNYRRSKTSGTILVMVTIAFRAIICVDVDTTVTTIIIAVGSIGFIITIAITNQVQVGTDWNSKLGISTVARS